MPPKKEEQPAVAKERAIEAEDLAKQIGGTLHCVTGGDLQMAIAACLIASANLLHAGGVQRKEAGAAFRAAYDAVDPYMGKSRWIN